MRRWQGGLSVSLILGGCFLNNVVLEYIILYDRGAGALMTLFQFVFVALMSLPQHLITSAPVDTVTSSSSSSSLSSSSPSSGVTWRVWQWRLRREAPLWEYIRLTLMFFAISVANNKAFAWGIRQPFNVVFRSSSLLISFLIGRFAFGQRYSVYQLISVLCVTVGVLITTSAEFFSFVSDTATSSSSSSSSSSAVSSAALFSCCSNLWSHVDSIWRGDSSEFASWLVGTFLLASTLIGLAVLGHMQNAVYKKYGSSSQENMFYSHLLPLPLFLMMSSDLTAHVTLWNASPPWRLLPFASAPTLPSLWILCFLNAVTQWICVQGVYQTTATLGTLTATLATTIRKFMSLVFSLIFFENSFTVQHWIGSALVFLGSLLYLIPSPRSVKKKED